MPEGPEVRTNTDQLRKALAQQVVTQVIPTSGKLLREGILNLQALELPQLVTDVGCKGKLIYVDFANGARLTSTLGMAGWWYPSDSAITHAYTPGKGLVDANLALTTARKHTRVTISGEASELVAYCDPRNFGNMRAWAPADKRQALAHIGLDLLELSNFLHDKLWIMYARQVMELIDQASRYHRLPLGELLLTQELIAGLGNIYRAEALYLSRLSPFDTWAKLEEADKLRLIENACTVLNIAYFTKGFMYYTPELMSKNGFPAQKISGRTLVYAQELTPFNEPVFKGLLGSRTIWYSR